ncbi:glycosyltransferase family A protein [Caldivirga sp. UBA161]|uniref:glycosyltransferase family A protein n=1 Tax=Caldivirga sp. UBA161 TaxID=1915569 RepID=UPI0025C66158|nr:glycosyltransferase family A protein [Caldivirga sp. UBA161]
MSIKVTIVVTCYRRQAYLPLAIKSIKAQSRQPDEIIVVKSPEVRLLEGSVKVIDDDSPHIGKKIIEAAEEATGDIIMFLDDDDEFEKNKVNVVSMFFENISELTYVHNSTSCITNSGMEVRKVRYHFRIPPYVKPCSQINQQVIFNLSDDYEFNRWLWAGAAFNASSISIRREVLMKVKHYVSQISVISDSVLYYSAALNGGLALLIPDKLTKYRVHEGNVSRGRLSSFNDYVESMRILINRVIHDYAIICEMTKGSKFERYACVESIMYNAIARIFNGQGELSLRYLNSHTFKYYLMALLPGWLKNIIARRWYEASLNPFT